MDYSSQHVLRERVLSRDLLALYYLDGVKFLAGMHDRVIDCVAILSAVTV